MTGVGVEAGVRERVGGGLIVPEVDGGRDGGGRVERGPVEHRQVLAASVSFRGVSVGEHARLGHAIRPVLGGPRQRRRPRDVGGSMRVSISVHANQDATHVDGGRRGLSDGMRTPPQDRSTEKRGENRHREGGSIRQRRGLSLYHHTVPVPTEWVRLLADLEFDVLESAGLGGLGSLDFATDAPVAFGVDEDRANTAILERHLVSRGRPLWWWRLHLFHVVGMASAT